MITLIKLSEDLFQVVDTKHDINVSGDLDRVTEVLRDCQVDDYEIEIALDELDFNGDNKAYFGVAKRFTYSENTGEFERGVA